MFSHVHLLLDVRASHLRIIRETLYNLVCWPGDRHRILDGLASISLTREPNVQLNLMA